MSKLVVEGAQLQCSMGNAPSALAVPDQTIFTNDDKNVATVMSFQPNVHIKPFGVCMSMNNPQVAAATSAAMGVLTPQPCIPNVVAPWSPGAPFITIETPQGAALTDDSTCNCLWGGLVQISTPGQQITTITQGSSGGGGSSSSNGAAKGGGGAPASAKVTTVAEDAAAASYLSAPSGEGLGKSDVYSVVVGVFIKDETTATNPLDRDGTDATLSGAAPSGPKLSGGSGQVFLRFEGVAAGHYTIKGTHRVSTGGTVDVEDSRDVDVGPGSVKAGTKQVETVLEMKRRPTVRVRVVDDRDGSVVPSDAILSIKATPDFVSTIDESTHTYEVEEGTKYKVEVKPKRGLLYELSLDVTGKAGIQDVEAKLPHRKNVLFVYIDNAEDKIIATDPLGHWPNVKGLEAAAAVDPSLNVKWMLCTAVGATPADLEAQHHPLAIFGAGSFWYWNNHIRSPSSMAMLNAWMKVIHDMDVPMLAVCGSHQLVAVAMHGGDWGVLAHMDDGGPPKPILDDVARGEPGRIDSKVRAHEEGVFPIATTAAGASDPLASAMSATTNDFAIHHEDMVTNTSGATLIFQESSATPDTKGRPWPKTRCHVEGLRYELPNRILYTVQFHPEVPTFTDVASGTDSGNGSKLVQAWLKLCVDWWKKGPPEL